MSVDILINCHFCKKFETHMIVYGSSAQYKCSDCAKNYRMFEVISYYLTEDIMFATSLKFSINDKIYVVESYFDGICDCGQVPTINNSDLLVNNSMIYCHSNNENVFIPGHPFTIENVKEKTRTYLLFS